METKTTPTFTVVTKDGKFVQSVTPFMTCKDEGAAKHFSADEAEKAINIIENDHFIYGARAKEIAAPAPKKSRKSLAGCKWVKVNGKRTLVRAGEPMPDASKTQDTPPVVEFPISPKSPNDNIGNFGNTAENCEELRKTAENCDLSWRDVKLIFRRAHNRMTMMDKYDLLMTTAEEFFTSVLEDYNSLKNLCD